MKFCLLLIAALTANCYASSAGRRFQLVFLENIVNYPKDGPLEVHISNPGTVAATVTVSTPMHSNSNPSETVTVNPDTITQVNVPFWMRLQVHDYWPSYKTILVESDQDIMVYAYNKELFSADGYYAIPTTELAYSYVLAAYDPANIATQFAISATSAKTNVQVTLPSPSLPVQVNYQGSVYTNGQTFTMILDEFETFLGRCRGDLTGTRVLASNQIAVFSSNVRSKENSGSRDHLAAQLHPTGDWGLQYALIPVPRDTLGDTVRVVARRANTPFTINNNDGSNELVNLASPGSFHEFTLTQACTITATLTSRPVQVVQMSKSQSAPRISDVADPTMFLLVARSQWLNKYISPSLVYQKTDQSYDINYALIAIADGQEGGLRVDGAAISASWSRVNGIAMTRYNVGSGSHIYTHNSDQGFSVMIYGASDRESYGFALGAGLTNSGCQESLMTKGDNIDNDCDGSIDEETCDNIDNDADGLVDEDCETAGDDAVGNKYVIMFIENNVDDNPNAQSFVEIYISAANASKSVTYTLETDVGINRVNQVISPGEVAVIEDRNAVLIQKGNGISNQAIRINATDDIVVYGVNKLTFSTDAFLAFPTDSVGTEYYSANYHPGDDLNQFGFTPAQEGSTVVEITLPENPNVDGTIVSDALYNGQRVLAGSTVSVTLQYGETAQFQAASVNDNLNGAYIKSDKPISVFSGNVRAKVDPTNLRSRDHLVQQLVPVNAWGVEFVTLPVPRGGGRDRGDVFIVTASQDNTELTIAKKTKVNGVITGTSSETETITKRGGFVQFDIGTFEYSHIKATKPVQVFQYVKTSENRNEDPADPAMMMIPPVDQWSRNYQFILPRTGQREDPNDDTSPFKYFDNIVLIAIDTTKTAGVMLDGAALPSESTWLELTGSNYSAIEVTVQNIEPNRHTLTHSEGNIMFQALMYGRADRESYALPLGMRVTESQCTETLQTNGDGIDNDCDNEIDEETCDNIDNDLDGRVDEDCSSGDVSGYVFYVTFMENDVEYPLGLDLELYAAVTGNKDANIRVRAPMVSFPKYEIETSVKPGEVHAFGFASGLKNEAQGISGKTVLLRSGVDIVVYGVNKEKFSNDAFLVYPESSLGTDHYVCTWSPSTLPTEFAVVSTSDGTVVTITLPADGTDLAVEANGAVYGAGDTFQITLNEFEVYQAQSVGDLTGTRVQSTVRAAVFAGNVRTKIEFSGSRDHLVQQMLPTTAYGTEFSVVPIPGRSVGDVLKIVANTDNTEIRVDGTLVDTITNAGGAYQFNLPSTAAVVLTATNPVMVMQFVKSQDGRSNPERADPAMCVVPSNNNFVSLATFITPVYSGGPVLGEDYINYVTLVIQSGQQGNVLLNGNALDNPSWTQIGSSSYVTTTITVDSGRTHSISAGGALFNGRLYGRADRESYAFPIGFRFV